MDDGRIYIPFEKRQMTGYGYKQTSSRLKFGSPLPPSVDILAAGTDFRL
jgi:hypothetical protein